MQSSREENEIVAGRFELANARSNGNQHDDSVHLHDEELGTGVWNSNVASRQSTSKRQKVILSAVFLGLVLVAVLLHSSSRNNDSSAPLANDSDTTQVTSTTEIPTTLSSTTPPPKSFTCQGDRINNNARLETNHFVCSANDRYRFGMDETGSLLFADDVINKTAFIFNGTAGDYFMLLQDATFTVSNSSDAVVWEAPCSDNVSLHPECLPVSQDEVYDCPYLHLHNGGTLVLNYISGRDWKARSSLHTHNLGQCKRDNFFCD